MSDFHKFKVNVGQTLADLAVEIDGEPVKGVTGIAFSLTAGLVTEVRLTLMGEVLVEGGFHSKEIAQIQRDMIHPGVLRQRIENALVQAFPGVPLPYIKSLSNSVTEKAEP